MTPKQFEAQRRDINLLLEAMDVDSPDQGVSLRAIAEALLLLTTVLFEKKS